MIAAADHSNEHWYLLCEFCKVREYVRPCIRNKYIAPMPSAIGMIACLILASSTWGAARRRTGAKASGRCTRARIAREWWCSGDWTGACTSRPCGTSGATGYAGARGTGTGASRRYARSAPAQSRWPSRPTTASTPRSPPWPCKRRGPRLSWTPGSQRTACPWSSCAI